MIETKYTHRMIKVVKVNPPISKNNIVGSSIQKVEFETEGIRPIRLSSLEPISEGWAVGMTGSASFDSKGNLVKFSRQTTKNVEDTESRKDIRNSNAFKKF